MKIRFTGEEQARYLKRVDGIGLRVLRMVTKTVFKPEPWTNRDHNRARLMVDMQAAWRSRRIGWWGDVSDL